MRTIALLALGAALVAAPALAQSGHDDTSPRGRHSMRSSEARSPGPPLDRGPRGSDVNRAYMGGGVILEGAPGAPAPMPEPTPPGQRPRGMVEPMTMR